MWLAGRQNVYALKSMAFLCHHHTESHVLSIKELIQKGLWVMFILNVNYLGTTSCKTKHFLAFLLIL